MHFHVPGRVFDTQCFRRGRVDLILLHKPDNAFSKRTLCFAEIVRDQYFAWVRSWETQKADCAFPCSRPRVRHAVFQKGQGRPHSAPQSRQCVFKTHPVKACSTRSAVQKLSGTNISHGLEVEKPSKQTVHFHVPGRVFDTHCFRRGRVDLILLHKADNAFSKRTL